MKKFNIAFTKDSSRDFLSGQSLAQVLGQVGCQYSDFRFLNSRLNSVFRFLAISDWKVPANSYCPFEKGYIFLKSDFVDTVFWEAQFEHGEFVVLKPRVSHRVIGRVEDF